jgi:hypothetical protein
MFCHIAELLAQNVGLFEAFAFFWRAEVCPFLYETLRQTSNLFAKSKLW